MCVREGREIDSEMGHSHGKKVRNCWNKSCVRKQRGIPIRETNEGTAEDDSNIWQLASQWWTEGDREKEPIYIEANMWLCLAEES